MKRRTMIMACLALLFASCSNDDGLLQPTQPLKDTPIQVNVAVADLQTRTGYDNSNLPDKFYMKITHPNEGSKYNYDVMMRPDAENKWMSYEYDGTTPVLMLWAGDNKDISVTAATVYLDSVNPVEIETDQSTEYNVTKSDHLLMPARNVTPSASGIDVTFKHMMAKIKLEIELKDEFDASTNPFANVSIDGTLPGRFYNFGTVAEGESPWGDSYLPVTPITLLFKSFVPAENLNRPRGDFEAILIPQTVEAGKFIVRFKVGEREFKWVYAEPISLEGGTVYTLKLIAGHDKVSSASFSASDWNKGNAISGETE